MCLDSIRGSILMCLDSIRGSILMCLDSMVCNGCCATLDNIVSYLFKKVTQKGKARSRAVSLSHSLSLFSLTVLAAIAVVQR